MGTKKCCKARPPCKDCPKRGKKKANCAPQGDFLRGAVDRDHCATFYFVPPAAMSINGQRGCTAKSPAGFAGVPA
jgi:hypothetical protein